MSSPRLPRAPWVRERRTHLLEQADRAFAERRLEDCTALITELFDLFDQAVLDSGDVEGVLGDNNQGGDDQPPLH